MFVRVFSSTSRARHKLSQIEFYLLEFITIDKQIKYQVIRIESSFFFFNLSYELGMISKFE